MRTPLQLLPVLFAVTACAPRALAPPVPPPARIAFAPSQVRLYASLSDIEGPYAAGKPRSLDALEERTPLETWRPWVGASGYNGVVLLPQRDSAGRRQILPVLLSPAAYLASTTYVRPAAGNAIVSGRAPAVASGGCASACTAVRARGHRQTHPPRGASARRRHRVTRHSVSRPPRRHVAAAHRSSARRRGSATRQARSSAASSGYYTGPRGGCYTYTSGGRKRYVDHSYCN